MELSPSRFFRTGTNELDHGALAKDGKFGSASPSDGNGGRIDSVALGSIRGTKRLSGTDEILK